MIQPQGRMVSRRRLIASWVFIVLAFYAYERAGLGYAFILLLAAALVRIPHDAAFAEWLKTSRTFKRVILGYYALLAPLAVLSPRGITDLSGVAFTAVLMLPLLLAVIAYDVYSYRANRRL